AELRPHLTLDDFMELVARMQKTHGYQMVYLDDNGIKALAGIRISEWLYAGKYLEIDDLVVTADSRAQGYGGMLFDWVRDYAKEMQCNHLRLVSGVQREAAHRFYLNKGMKFEAKYFSLDL
ncbi:MAG TPA: GNAT family N-acetyltransferase, partial [Cellvibrio sp.]|nr:GNAT family N-acetyltransferase [Cellvibrio sp.]